MALTAAQLYGRVAITGAQASVAALKGVAGQADKTHSSLNKIGKGAGQLAFGLAKIGAVAGGILVAGIGAAAKITGDYQADLQTINTIAKLDGNGIATLGEGIRRFSAASGADLKDLTSAEYDLLSAGVKVGDSQKLLEGSFRLGRAALGSTNDAVNVLTFSTNAYLGKAQYAGKTTQQLARIFSDQFAQAVEDGVLKLTDISASISDVTPIAAQMGIGINQIAAGYAFMTSKGTAASEVTTEMNRAMVELLKPSSDLVKLQDKTGKQYAEIARKKGLVPTLVEMRKDAAKNGIAFQDLFGRIEAYKFALSTTADGGKAFAAEQAKINDATKNGGETAKQYAIRQQGLQVALAKLRSTAIDTAITFGEGLTPAVGRFADRFANFIRDHRGDIKTFGQDVGRAIDGIPWDKVEHGAQTFYDLMKLIYEVVKKIPPEVDAAGVGLLGLNKLSGGLLAQGAGNIASGALGGIGRTLLAKIPKIGGALSAATATPVFVTNWPGGVGGMGGGAAAGGGGSALAKGLAAAAIGGAALELYETQLKPLNAAIDRQSAQIKEAVTGVATRTDADLKAQAAALGQGLADLSNLGPAADIFYGDQKRILSLGLTEIETELRKRANIAAGDTRSEAAQQRRDVVQTTAGKILPGDTRSEGGLSAMSRPLVAGLRQLAAEFRQQLAKAGRGIGQGQLAAARQMVQGFIRGSSPFYRDSRHAAAGIRALEGLQRRYLAVGDRRTAASIGREIRTMQGIERGILRKKSTVVIKPTPVTFKVDGRQLAYSVIRYGGGAVPI